MPGNSSSESDTVMYTDQIMYYLIGFTGVVSNGIVLIAIGMSNARQPKLVNIYFLNQSAIDLCASLCLILSNLDVDPDYTKASGDVVCKFWTSKVMLWSLLMSSTFNLVVTSLDRYFMIVHPSWHKNAMNKTRRRLMFGFAWLSGFIWNVPMIVATSGVVDGACLTVAIWPNVACQRIVGIMGIVLQFFIPLGILIFSYTRILMILHKKRSSTTSATPSVSTSSGGGTARATTRGQQNVIKTLITVGVVFTLCWLTNQLLFIYFNFGGEVDFNGHLYHISVILVFSNCCVNPFVYLAKNQQCRRSVKTMFKMKQVSTHPVSESVQQQSTTDQQE